MSDVGRLKRTSSPFPTVRKSADPMQPEMGEMDFAQDVEEFDSAYSTAVHEAEKAEQTAISDQNPRKQYRRRKRKRKDEEDEEKKEDTEILVDIRV